MINKKALIFGTLFGILFAIITGLSFYGKFPYSYDKTYMMGLFAVMPVIIVFLFYVRSSDYQGNISGKTAVRVGMNFIFMSTIVIIGLKVFLFYNGLREFKIEYIKGGIEQMPSKDLSDMLIHGKMVSLGNAVAKNDASTIAAVKAVMKSQTAESVTLFAEITSVVFGFVFYGLISSFLGAIFVKKW